MPRRPKLAEALPLDIKPAVADVQRFLAFCKQAGDCWLWQGHCDSNGYGQFKYGGIVVGAHRFSYAFFRGPIPRRRHVHHERQGCPHNCVAPHHLAPLTPARNGRDGGQRRHAGTLFNRD